MLLRVMLLIPRLKVERQARWASSKNVDMSGGLKPRTVPVFIGYYGP